MCNNWKINNDIEIQFLPYYFSSKSITVITITPHIFTLIMINKIIHKNGEKIANWETLIIKKEITAEVLNIKESFFNNSRVII